MVRTGDASAVRRLREQGDPSLLAPSACDDGAHGADRVVPRRSAQEAQASEVDAEYGDIRTGEHVRGLEDGAVTAESDDELRVRGRSGSDLRLTRGCVGGRRRDG